MGRLPMETLHSCVFGWRGGVGGHRQQGLSYNKYIDAQVAFSGQSFQYVKFLSQVRAYLDSSSSLPSGRVGSTLYSSFTMEIFNRLKQCQKEGSFPSKFVFANIHSCINKTVFFTIFQLTLFYVYAYLIPKCFSYSVINILQNIWLLSSCLAF